MLACTFLLAFISELCVWSVAASLLPEACLVLLGKLFSLYFIWLFPVLPAGNHLHKYDYVHFIVQYIHKFWQNDRWFCSTLLLCFLFMSFYKYILLDWCLRVYIFLYPTYFHMISVLFWPSVQCKSYKEHRSHLYHGRKLKWCTFLRPCHCVICPI